MRKVNDAELVGKTIESIENSAINVLKLIFTDGTSISLWAEISFSTDYGSVPGIFVSDSSVDVSETAADPTW